MELNVTSSNFENEVVGSKLPVLVDFWAPWCGPCKMIAPHIVEIAKEYKDKIKVCKVNVDEASEVATKYVIMSIPALVVFKAGNVMQTKVGMMNKRDIEKLIQPYIK